MRFIYRGARTAYNSTFNFCYSLKTHPPLDVSNNTTFSGTWQNCWSLKQVRFIGTTVYYTGSLVDPNIGAFYFAGDGVTVESTGSGTAVLVTITGGTSGGSGTSGLSPAGMLNIPLNPPDPYIQQPFRFEPLMANQPSSVVGGMFSPEISRAASRHRAPAARCGSA